MFWNRLLLNVLVLAWVLDVCPHPADSITVMKTPWCFWGEPKWACYSMMRFTVGSYIICSIGWVVWCLHCSNLRHKIKHFGSWTRGTQ